MHNPYIAITQAADCCTDLVILLCESGRHVVHTEDGTQTVLFCVLTGDSTRQGVPQRASSHVSVAVDA